MRPTFFFTTILFVSYANHASTTSGSIELDEFNFNKVINKFEASLIKFDISFPFGDKHKAFKAFAKESIHEKDLLITEVLMNDSGDRTNEALARKYGVTKNNLPVVMLFVKGKSKPISFDDWNVFTSDELRRFVKDNRGLYLSLPGCVKEFDKLAIQFMKGKKDERKKVLKKTEKLLKNTEKVVISWFRRPNMSPHLMHDCYPYYLLSKFILFDFV